MSTTPWLQAAGESIRTSRRLVAAVMTVATILACAPREPAPADSLDASTASATSTGRAVQLLSPADGDSVSLPFTVTLGVTGVEVVPATGKREEGKGHHHLLIDAEAPAGDSLPLGAPPAVIHMGNGASERVLDSLPRGRRRIIAIFAWGDHVPMTGVARDTITVIVR